MKKTYTDKQGQYLAFIYYYSKIHGCSPSEAEMQQYFLSLAASCTSDGVDTRSARHIARTPGQARSIHLLISRDELPDLV